ncbi:spermidine synthase [Neisseria sp. HSC-16F19]|nr:polyamine aminopropyltransferase [Neisseria sp. HSC-16F19]MCP2040855.1 spermidine synthase [Neisseria sp. HSC-16F19]
MSRHPYRRLRPARAHLPEVGISEEGNIRSLHLGSATVQSSMNVDHPSELVLSYSRAMMAWLLFAETAPKHIVEIGLGGGSFVRWLDAHLPEVRQTVVEINPQVIAVAKSLFELPFEGERFEIIEDDGAEYIKVLYGSNIDVLLVDGFDGEQIIDDLVGEPFFADCRAALGEHGIFVTNWWQGDKRYPAFVERLRRVFGAAVLAVPAATHGNVAVLAFKQPPQPQSWEALKKRAAALDERYGLGFAAMLAAVKAEYGGKSCLEWD